jgi:hypothetical protein
MVLAWSLPFVTALPKSPGWALPMIGGLIIAGDTGDPRTPAPVTGGDALLSPPRTKPSGFVP